jgi:penicillin-binding protein 1A
LLSQTNRAIAMRQPGTTLMPFIYATALDKGYTPVSKVVDGPFSAPQGPGLPLWTPENYEAGEYLGPTTLRRGLEQSRNLMTVKLADTIGMESIADTVDRMGVYNKLPPDVQNSLGAEMTTLLNLTTGYAEFVNGGRKLEATLIDRVQDRHGKTIYRFDKRNCADCNQADWREGMEEPLLEENQQQVLDPRTAYQMVSILEGVIKRGTGQSIRVLNRPLAGKTGTSSDLRDAWFIGFSPDLAVGVFVGKDDSQTLGNGEEGALAAAPIVRDFMKEALADVPPTPFRIPQGIALVPTNPFTGAVVRQGSPGAIVEAFKAGTEPGAAYTVSDIDNAGFAGPAGSAGGAERAKRAPTQRAATSRPAPRAAPSNPPQPAAGMIRSTPTPKRMGNGTGGLY